MLATASRRAAFSGNTSLIATFSSWIFSLPITVPELWGEMCTARLLSQGRTDGQTDRRTDGRMDGFAVAYTAVANAKLALRCTVKICTWQASLKTHKFVTWSCIQKARTLIDQSYKIYDNFNSMLAINSTLIDVSCRVGTLAESPVAILFK